MFFVFYVMLEDKGKFQNIDRLLRKRHITTVTMVIQERVGFTEPPTGMSNRKLPGGKARLTSKADSLTAISEPFFFKECVILDISQPNGLHSLLQGCLYLCFINQNLYSQFYICLL
jgi:hypothetical protein